MMKEIIAIDIDDTINNFTELYFESAKEFDKTLRNTGVVNPDEWVTRRFDWSKEEIIQFKKKYRAFVHANAKVKENVTKVLKKLQHKYEIWFVSARVKENFDLLFDGSLNWLKTNNIPFDKFFIETNKPEFLKDKNVAYFIDDNEKTCAEMQKIFNEKGKGQLLFLDEQLYRELIEEQNQKQ